MKTHIEIYKGRDKCYHWRMKRKGRIVADGSEGYRRETTLRKVLLQMVRGGFILSGSVIGPVGGIPESPIK